VHLRVENIRQVPFVGETLGFLDTILELLSTKLPLDHLTTPSVSLISRFMSGRSAAKEMIDNTLRAV